LKQNSELVEENPLNGPIVRNESSSNIFSDICNVVVENYSISSHHDLI